MLCHDFGEPVWQLMVWFGGRRARPVHSSVLVSCPQSGDDHLTLANRKAKKRKGEKEKKKKREKEKKEKREKEKK